MKKVLALVLTMLLSASVYAALTSKKTGEAVIGGVRLQFWDIEFPGVTTGNFLTGLRDVMYANCTNEKTEGDGQVVTNSSDGSATTAGAIYFSGFTGSDVANCIIIGR